MGDKVSILFNKYEKASLICLMRMRKDFKFAHDQEKTWLSLYNIKITKRRHDCLSTTLKWPREDMIVSLQL